MRQVWLFVGLVLAAGLSGQRRPPGTVVVGELGARLEAAVATAAPDHWGTVLVTMAGKPVFVRGYGPIDRRPPKRGRQPKHMDTKAVFDLCSASQVLTSLLAVRLEATRKLRLDDPVAKYLDDWPKDKRAITIDHLLMQTSGLPREARWKKNAHGGLRPALASIAQTPLRAAPGQEVFHSPINGILLAIVLEECAGQRFDKLLAERVLKPFGMTGAGHCDERFAAKLVTVRRKDGEDHPGTDQDYNWRHRGARGILASVHDVHALLDRLTLGKLVDARQRDLLFRPIPKGGLTIATAKVGERSLRQVNASLKGYRTRWLIHEASRSWVVLCTADDQPIDALQTALLAELGEALSATESATPPEPEPDPEPARVVPKPVRTGPAVSDEQLDRFVGTFALPTGGVFRIARRDGRLRLRGEGTQASVRLVDGAWPGQRGARAQRSEDRGLALLDRLVRGDATAVDEAFTDSVIARNVTTTLAAIVVDHGTYERVEFLGNAVPRRGVVESWFRVVCARGAATVRLQWHDERHFAACRRTDEGPPFAVDLAVVAPDQAGGQSVTGKLLRLTIEGRGDRRTLVFEDSTAGEDGLIDCREIVK